MPSQKRFSRRDFLRVSALTGATILTTHCSSPTSVPPPAAPVEPTASQLAASPSPVLSPAPNGPATITYWYWADTPAIGEFFRKVADDFNARQSEVKVNAEAQPNTAAAKEKLVANAAAGHSGVDVTYANTSWQQELYEAGISQPVGPYFDNWSGKADVFPRMIETHKIKPDQPLLCMPWGFQVDYHYYRTDIFREAGVEAPTTFEDLVSTARALNQPPNRYGLGLRGADQFGFLLNFTDYLLGHGLTFSDGMGGSDLDSPIAVDVAQQLAQLYYDGVIQPSAPQDRYAQMVALLQSGKIPQWTGSNNHSAMLGGADGEFHSKLDVVPVPHGKDFPQFTQVASACNMMLKDSKNKDAGWTWIAAMMEADTQAEFAKTVGFSPVSKSVAEQPAFQESKYHQLAFATEPGWGIYPYWHKNWVKFFSVDGPQLWQQVMLKQMDVKDMMSRLAALMKDV